MSALICLQPAFEKPSPCLPAVVPQLLSGCASFWVCLILPLHPSAGVEKPFDPIDSPGCRLFPALPTTPHMWEVPRGLPGTSSIPWVRVPLSDSCEPGRCQRGLILSQGMRWHLTPQSQLPPRTQEPLATAQADSLGWQAAQIPKPLSYGAVKTHLSVSILCINNNKTLPPFCGTKLLQALAGICVEGSKSCYFPLTKEPRPGGKGRVL